MFSLTNISFYIKISSQKIHAILYIKNGLWKQSIFVSKDPSLFQFTNNKNVFPIKLTLLVKPLCALVLDFYV